MKTIVILLILVLMIFLLIICCILNEIADELHYMNHKEEIMNEEKTIYKIENNNN